MLLLVSSSALSVLVLLDAEVKQFLEHLAVVVGLTRYAHTPLITGSTLACSIWLDVVRIHVVDQSGILAHIQITCFSFRINLISFPSRNPTNLVVPKGSGGADEGKTLEGKILLKMHFDC